MFEDNFPRPNLKENCVHRDVYYNSNNALYTTVTH